MTQNRYDFLEISGWAGPMAREKAPDALASAMPDAPAPVRPTTARRTFKLVEVIGEFGADVGQFNRPTDVAMDWHDTLYVADCNNHRIQRITAEGEVDVLGSRGAGPGRLMLPTGIAVDTAGCAYVVEQGNHRLQKFGPSAKVVYTVGTQGHGLMQFTTPMAITLDAQHNCFIADAGNNRITSYSAKGQYRGQLLQAKPDDRLNRPHGVSAGPDGLLAVADTWNHRIIVFDVHGKALMCLGTFGRAPGEMNLPMGVVFDADGGLIVSEAGNHRLQKFSPVGIPIVCWTGDDSPIGKLASPGALALTRNGDLYLADTGNHRIVRFELW